MHTATCFMCNEGRGIVRKMIGRSQTAEDNRQWHGPFPGAGGALDAATALLAITPGASVRECRRCKPGRDGIVAPARDGPSHLRYVNLSGHTPLPTPNSPYWMKVVTKLPLHATIHLDFCGVVNRRRTASTSSHGTGVGPSVPEAGWYGPYASYAEAQSAAVHVQQAGGLIRDCLQCFHASHRYRKHAAEISPKQRFEPDIDGPAVPVDQSVSRDHITCLECGQRTQLLTIHLRRTHQTAPNEYRLKWSLPDAYPMESEGYRRWRSGLYFAAHAADE
jgi:predicted transcriptional regulator